MKITRILKDKRGEWQITLNDDEVVELSTGLVMASLAHRQLPALSTIASLTLVALCSKVRDQHDISKSFDEVRDKTIPRFVLDTTAILKKDL